jgi:hypothetical protein
LARYEGIGTGDERAKEGYRRLRGWLNAMTKKIYHDAEDYIFNYQPQAQQGGQDENQETKRLHRIDAPKQGIEPENTEGEKGCCAQDI